MKNAVLPSDLERAENARLIQESAAFVSSPDRLHKMRAGRSQLPGFDRADWRALAELGWFGLRVPESHGGVGLGVFELCALAEQLGSGLTAGPILSAIVTSRLAPESWTDQIIDGTMVVVSAWQEQRGIKTDALLTRLSNGRLTGEKRYVPMAAGADGFLVTTRDGLAFIERDAEGVSLSTDMFQDGSHFGTLRFTDAPAVPVSGDFDLACEEITLATAAYLLGTMQRAFAITTAYLTTRKQFGKAIGSFQAIQHRMVDLHIQIELTRASIYKAATLLDDSTGRDSGVLAVSRAKARASDAAMFVTRQAVQLHGAIGYTDACDIGLYLRKALVLANFHGSATQHHARFAHVSAQEAG